MTEKILVSYLSYVNNENNDRREVIFNTTLESLKKLKKNDKSLSFLAIDNNSNQSTVSKLKNSEIFDYSIYLSKNYYDMSLLYYTAKVAIEKNIKYILYSYDDFEFYDFNFGSACINFLENNLDVASIRMPICDIDNMHLYNADITSKRINPDATRHYNQPARNQLDDYSLNIEGPFTHEDKDFYKANWHYTSRPTLWRTECFAKIFEDIPSDKMPVMQAFEGFAMKYFYKQGMKSSFINMGVSKTFTQSERIHSGGHRHFENIILTKESMDDHYNKTFK